MGWGIYISREYVEGRGGEVSSGLMLHPNKCLKNPHTCTWNPTRGIQVSYNRKVKLPVQCHRECVQYRGMMFRIGFDLAMGGIPKVEIPHTLANQEILSLLIYITFHSWNPKVKKVSLEPGKLNIYKQ